MKEPLLVSACLVGVNCKYSGGNNALPPELLAALEEKYRLVPICPERDGGLPTPRLPSERRGELVVNRAGEDVTEAFRRGAQFALETARREGCRLALLKERGNECEGEIAEWYEYLYRLARLTLLLSRQDVLSDLHLSDGVHVGIGHQIVIVAVAASRAVLVGQLVDLIHGVGSAGDCGHLDAPALHVGSDPAYDGTSTDDSDLHGVPLSLVCDNRIVAQSTAHMPSPSDTRETKSQNRASQT